MLKMIEKVEYGRYSEDKNVNIFLKYLRMLIPILSALDGKEPYLKWLILILEHMEKDYEIMKSYQIDTEKYPAIYMYNETTNKIKEFKMNDMKDRCLSFKIY